MAVSVAEELNVIAVHGAYRAPYRRVATRYDKLAANYLAFIQLASIRLWLRINESTT
jgi:transposase